MYDQYFDAASDLDAEETLERAYALGVASVCGDPADAEYERLKAASPDAYDESLVELAFEEGRAEALDLRADSETDDESIWETLVESGLDFDSVPDGSRRSGLPEALLRSDRELATDGPPESLDLPSFLKK